MRKLNAIVLLLLALLPLGFVRGQDAPASGALGPAERNPDAKLPTRPEKGPGSADYAHKSVTVAEAGEKALHYWVYTPAEPAPKDAPVVCFVHGFGALKPDPYIGWIHHICRRGNIVVYPQYQEHALEPAANYAPNSATSVLEAIRWLKEDKTRVQPRETDFAIVGHSAGGVTAANMAADWETLKLPKPRVVMPVQPGRAFSFDSAQQKDGLIPLSDFAKIPQDCLLLCAYSDSDTTVGHWCARKIFADATEVKAENKNLVEMRSCTLGSKPLLASHRSPAAPEKEEDPLDWFGWWKLFDGLCDSAFSGKNREYALGNTARQRFMGKYSDDRPVTELAVTLGNAKVDPDEAYTPRFDRNGRPFRARATERPQAPPEAPKEVPKKEERPAKEEEF